MFWYANRPTQGRTAFEKRAKKKIGKVLKLGQDKEWSKLATYIGDNQLWGNGVKEHYADHQNRKCGYCERFVTDYGDVEHYRPKNAIFTLKTRGEERPGLSNIKGRTYNKFGDDADVWDSGYWWLVYSWDNYLVACGRCNQNWKNALFPIKNGHQARPQEGDELVEEPLLLDPYGDRDPAQYLAYDSGGAIRSRDNNAIGQQTIDVCGLDRPSLIMSRLITGRMVERKLKKVLKILRDPNPDTDNLRSALEDIFDFGSDEALNAGMARIMFTQTTGWTWEQLNNFLNK